MSNHRISFLVLIGTITVAHGFLATVSLAQEPAEITLKQKLQLPAEVTKLESKGNSPTLGWSADGKWLAASWEQQVYCYDMATTKLAQTFPYQGTCHSLQFTPTNNELIVFPYYNEVSPIYSLKNGRQVGAIPLVRNAKEMQLHPKKRGNYFYCLRVTQNGQTAFGVVNRDETRRRQTGCALPNNVLDFYDSAISPGRGDYLAVSTDNRIFIIGTTRMSIVQDIQFLKRWPNLTEGATLLPSSRMVFSPDGKQLAVGYMRGPGRIFETKTAKLLPGFDKDDSLKFTPIGFSADGKRLACYVPVGKTFGFWKLAVLDASTGKILAQTKATVEDLDKVALSPDGQQFVVSFTGKTELQIWSVPEL